MGEARALAVQAGSLCRASGTGVASERRAGRGPRWLEEQEKKTGGLQRPRQHGQGRAGQGRDGHVVQDEVRAPTGPGPEGAPQPQALNVTSLAPT